MSIWELFYYGKIHGYWSCFSQFQRKSKETLDQVDDMMFTELYGISKQEYIDLKCEYLYYIQDLFI